ncbi:MAG: CoA-binding protein [Bacteroidetes bacterium]|nr:CoA-binding protein [Bacteroidota bacterium]
MMGRTVLQSEMAQSNLQMDISALSNGQYLLVMHEDGNLTLADVDTITLYLGPQNQAPYYDYCLGLKPRRIIFNPGTENPEFQDMATQQGIVCLEACTLVLLSTGQY